MIDFLLTSPSNVTIASTLVAISIVVLSIGGYFVQGRGTRNSVIIGRAGIAISVILGISWLTIIGMSILQSLPDEDDVPVRVFVSTDTQKGIDTAIADVTAGVQNEYGVELLNPITERNIHSLDIGWGVMVDIRHGEDIYEEQYLIHINDDGLVTLLRVSPTVPQIDRI